jgi:hypothetical protein
MAESGVVSQSRNGREVLFSLDQQRLATAAAWRAEVGARWDVRLAALRTYVQRQTTGSD